MAVLMATMASCSQDGVEEPMTSVQNKIRFVVDGFPAFGSTPSSRAVGTSDAGKTGWEEGDALLVGVEDGEYITLVYAGEEWTTEETLDLTAADVTVKAFYAPDYEVKEGSVALKDGRSPGMAEYIEAETSVSDGIVTISFEGVSRTYSRLRIAALPGETLTVTTTGFTPADGGAAPASYTLTTDAKSNAYLYGKFAEGGNVTVKNGETTLKEYTFNAATEAGKSYALSANVVVNALAAGQTDITVNLPADASDEMFAAIAEALAADGITAGSIDLTISGATSVPEYVFCNSKYWNDNYAAGAVLKSVSLPDATEIGDWAFWKCESLTSVNIPNVTKTGEYAFYACGFTSFSAPKCETLGVGTLAENFYLTIVNLSAVKIIGSGTDGEYGVFNNCGYLTKISLPEATTLGKYHFSTLHVAENGVLPEGNRAWLVRFYGLQQS